jgi:cyclic pyranopterin phosphate synthase
VRRINVSLDTRDRALFEQLARRDSLPQVLEGIAAARRRASGQAQHRRAQGLNEAEIPISSPGRTGRATISR